MKLYFNETNKDKVISIIGEGNLIETSYGGCVESSNPFAAAETAGRLKGIVDGFEIVQGKMDDVFLNVTNEYGRAV